MKKIIIGIMGPGESATSTDLENAYQLGQLIAGAGWILLTGGRNSGVMDAANKGAKAANGLTIGILPGNNTRGISQAVDIAIVTDMGNARNNINILSSDLIIACGMGSGTASEIALALKADKQVILLNDSRESQLFFKKLAESNIFVVNNAVEAMNQVREILANPR
ncbi:TIGR00725 family protein [Microcoleus sp. bin38.metabat.b11b12b14.051]|uniref:TIGR00725 family protein n=1 Tax=Microcoleus sp. bin38.metabat.b11b12b14.051 TaxID=2742709 RepID=UPI0025E6ABDC|nr:TIGR00725 family protein [Microcoleus sp. bin38.metabat.b11b12b14.051]